MMDVPQPDYQGKLRVKNCSVREMSLTGNEKDDFLGWPELCSNVASQVLGDRNPAAGGTAVFMAILVTL